jgi:protease-4
VRALAEGRVWTGSRAAELGLIDEVGGLDRAVELAREAAGIDPDATVRLDFYPRPASFFELLFGEREPALPSDVKALLSRLAPAPVRLLELSPRFAELSRPF